MRGSLLRVPPGGAVGVTVVDRRNDHAWTVTVAPFEISATVVTVEHWNDVMGRPAKAVPGGSLPVVEASWREAIAFCNELSRRSGLTPAYLVEVVEVDQAVGRGPHGRPAPDDWFIAWNRAATGYRLPTEAEWQLACGAGTTGPHYGPLDTIAWFADNSRMRRREVAGKAPNAWGLFDTIGGVWEWCWDLYDPAVYGAPTGSSAVGVGPTLRGVVVRGFAARRHRPRVSTTSGFDSPERSAGDAPAYEVAGSSLRLRRASTRPAVIAGFPARAVKYRLTARSTIGLSTGITWHVPRTS